MSAAMLDRDRVLGRHLIEILSSERTLVLELRIVVEVSLDPGARRRLLRLCAQLLNDAVDGHELDLERIADEDFI